ncbi:MAG: low molecular weight protein arginine phosphatase [Nitrospinota bacterium]
MLFVCTGNLCRSPMAAALLEKLARRDGLRGVEVDSAGTHALPGAPPPPEAVEVAGQVGVDLKAHRAGPLTEELVEWADRILVMEPAHADYVETHHPGAARKVEFLATYKPIPEPQGSVGDPIGQPLYCYRLCFGELMEAVQGLVRELKKSRGPRGAPARRG